MLAASDRLLGSSTVNLVEEDFLKAMRNFSPVAMRDISKFSPEISNGWEDVGGLSEVVNVIKEVCTHNNSKCWRIVSSNSKFYEQRE